MADLQNLPNIVESILFGAGRPGSSSTKENGFNNIG